MGAEMTVTLADRLDRDGRSVATVADWVNQRLDRDWKVVWDDHLDHLRTLFDTVGEPAYGAYNQALYRSIQQALNRQGLTCRPPLPGSLPLSEERWGTEDHRERRMWTLLFDRDDQVLGAIVTRFFHDHTELRLPRPPTVDGLAETDHETSRAIIVQDPRRWSRSA
jgi:hypothetical protein